MEYATAMLHAKLGKVLVFLNHLDNMEICTMFKDSAPIPKIKRPTNMPLKEYGLAKATTVVPAQISNEKTIEAAVRPTRSAKMPPNMTMTVLGKW